MFKSMRARASIAVAAVAASLCIAAAPASAQQEGLVNVALEDIVVQVPVGVAANICDVNVAVLVNDLRDDAAMCDATADPTAITPAGGNGPTPTQDGLVNVLVSDVTVQVPIAVAANVCDLNVAALVDLVQDEAAACEADASSVARGPNR
jgi:hypothetical protein